MQEEGQISVEAKEPSLKDIQLDAALRQNSFQEQ